MPSDYYSLQHVPRGLQTREDVLAVAGRCWRIYDGLLRKHLPGNRDARIYEVACGPGLVLAWLRQLGYRNARGSDFSEHYVRLATELGATAEVGDSIALLGKFDDHSLEVIFAIDFLEHLTREEAATFLALVNRKLVPGGVLILRVPNGDSPFFGRNFFNDITHQWVYSSTGLRSSLTLAGFNGMDFIDEASAPFPGWKKLLTPLSVLVRWISEAWCLLLARERVRYWSSNLFVVGRGGGTTGSGVPGLPEAGSRGTPLPRNG